MKNQEINIQHESNYRQTILFKFFVCALRLEIEMSKIKNKANNMRDGSCTSNKKPLL